MFGKITKQINVLIAPQSIARVRDPQALQSVFASYHVLLRQQRTENLTDPLPKRARSTAASSAADTAAFRRAVDAALATSPVAAAAAAAVTTQTSPATSTLSSATPSPSPLGPAGVAQQQQPGAAHAHAGSSSVVGAEQKMSLSLAPRDENSRAVVARCGFTPLLVLTFKMARRTLGSIVQHLALKWFSGVRLRTLPTASHQHQHHAPHTGGEAAEHAPHRPRKPAAVRYGMGRITLVLQHGGSGAVVGSWDRRNGALFSDFVPTLPTSISAPVLASPDAALPVLYTIAGIAPDDIIPIAPAPAVPSQQQGEVQDERQQQQEREQQQQQQSATWREQSDSIPQFHAFGHSAEGAGTAGAQQTTPMQQQQQQGRRGSDGWTPPRKDLGGAGATGTLEDVVHLDKSFTSFVLENAGTAGAGSQCASPLRAFAPLAPSAQATPQTPMRALFSSSAACSPATLATPTFSLARTSPVGIGSGAVGAGGSAAGTTGTPERLALGAPFFSSVVCALPGDAGASRDGLPKEDSQLALFPERSLGYSNPGLPFLPSAGAGGALGLGLLMGAASPAAPGPSGASGFQLFSGNTENSNF